MTQRGYLMPKLSVINSQRRVYCVAIPVECLCETVEAAIIVVFWKMQIRHEEAYARVFQKE